MLVEDPDGAIWCGTDHGVYRLERAEGKWISRFVDFGMPAGPDDSTLVEAMVQDKQGVLWVGTGRALYRRLPDGPVDKYTSDDGLPDTFINALFIDSEQRVWVGTRYKGLCRLTAKIIPHHSIVENRYGIKEGLGSNWIASLFETSDGTIWAGTNAGLSKAVRHPYGQKKFESYTTSQGLSDAEVWALAEDRDGSLLARNCKRRGNEAGAEWLHYLRPARRPRYRSRYLDSGRPRRRIVRRYFNVAAKVPQQIRR